MTNHVTDRPGTRTRRGFWFDPRFAIGLVLVVASVVGVWAIVASADRSVAVYAARDALSIGDRVVAADLTMTRVRLDSAGRLYVTPQRMPSDGLVVTRAVAAGELVPVSAVGTQAGASVTSVVVAVKSKLAGSLGPGSVVDVWGARETGQGQFGPPAVIVGSASVVRVIESTGLIADGTGQSVEILVPKAKVATVLEAIANQDAIALVPVNAPLGN
ncbi:hypothetical protein [Glaciibacter sp. 2TAF33]|uniref:hypothetical protein n=1 Tax=Glaciibacter sp. 2TAF33 TaxID=3233015 RepID=UPI003F9174B5